MLNYNDSDISRLLKVLKGEKPDRMPYLDWCYSKKVMENVLNREVGYEATIRADHSTKLKIDTKDLLDFIYAIGQDTMGYLILAPDDYSVTDGEKITKCIDIIEDRAAFKKVVYPDLSKYLLEYKESLEALLSIAPDYNIGITFFTGAIFQDTHQLIGFDNFMYKLHEDISYVEEVLGFFAEIYYEIAKFICSYDVSIFLYTDNIAYNSGPFFNPELFKKLYIPLMEKVLEPAREKGIPIMFDSDGDIEWMLPELIDIGISAVQPIDPGGMDIYKIKEKYGKQITILGNVGQEFPLSSGTVEDVKADVKKRIELLGKSGRYVVHSSHDIGDNVKTDNFIAMVETVHKYGRY